MNFYAVKTKLSFLSATHSNALSKKNRRVEMKRGGIIARKEAV